MYKGQDKAWKGTNIMAGLDHSLCVCVAMARLQMSLLPRGVFTTPRGRVDLRGESFGAVLGRGAEENDDTGIGVVGRKRIGYCIEG